MIAAALPQPAGARQLAQATHRDAPSFAFDPTPDSVVWEPKSDEVLSVPSFLAPNIDRSAAFQLRAERNGLARPGLEARTIRRGFSPASTSRDAGEGAVGLKLSRERFSVETAFVSGTGTWQSTDTRFDWSLARRSVEGNDGLRWGLTAGGNVAMTGAGSHNAGAMIGYRQQLLDTVTLNSEVAFATNYAFAARNAPATTVTPQLQVLADLTAPMSTPWKTVLDVKLSRQLPLSGSEFQSNASAMLRLKYNLR